MPPRILVAGVGNIFLGDDAFGSEVVRRLSKMPLPSNVHIVDFGIRSYDLAYALMEDWELVILVDATSCGDTPGTVYAIEADQSLADPASSAFDPHTMNPEIVLQLVRSLGGKPSRTLVVGCEPLTLEENPDGHIGLSPPVEAAVDEAICMVSHLIACNASKKAA